MKTTLVIDDGVYGRLKAKAARENRTISELVDAAIRLLLEKRPGVPSAAPLPSFRMKRARVDVADREALHDALDES